MTKKMYKRYRPMEKPTFIFISDTEHEIVSCLQYYNKRKGREYFNLPIICEEYGVVHINLQAPMLNPNHCIDVEVVENCWIHLNQNYFAWLIDCYVVAEEAYGFRGGMYKVPTVDCIYFICDRIMQAIRSYDWSQHIEKMIEWGTEREDMEEYLRGQGYYKNLSPSHDKMVERALAIDKDKQI